MGLKSAPDRYGAVAIALHWGSAILIAGLLFAGFRAAGTTDPAAKAALLRLHVPLGIGVLLLTLIRLGWRLFADRRPAEAPAPRIQQAAARVVHGLLYVAVIGLGVSGIALMAMSGAGDALFGGGVLPDFMKYPPRLGHGALARLLILLLALHVGAALYHQFVLRDGLLSRMGIGRPRS